LTKIIPETAKLEDFGARSVVSPKDRLKEYQSQSKGLPRKLQARFWLEVLKGDPEVNEIVMQQGGVNRDGRKD
jgi:hypothetical protein